MAQAVAAILLEPDSGWITGHATPVDGGGNPLRRKG
jgi:hypothetical protein